MNAHELDFECSIEGRLPGRKCPTDIRGDFLTDTMSISNSIGLVHLVEPMRVQMSVCRSTPGTRRLTTCRPWLRPKHKYIIITGFRPVNDFIFKPQEILILTQKISFLAMDF